MEIGRIVKRQSHVMSESWLELTRRWRYFRSIGAARRYFFTSQQLNSLTSERSKSRRRKFMLIYNQFLNTILPLFSLRSAVECFNAIHFLARAIKLVYRTPPNVRCFNLIHAFHIYAREQNLYCASAAKENGNNLSAQLIQISPIVSTRNRRCMGSFMSFRLRWLCASLYGDILNSAHTMRCSLVPMTSCHIYGHEK